MTNRQTDTCDAGGVQGGLIVFWVGWGLYGNGNGNTMGTDWDCRLKPGLEVLREALGAA